MAAPVRVGTLNNGSVNFDMMMNRIEGLRDEVPGCIETIPVPPTTGFTLYNSWGIRRERRR